jgi:hypothetical protein
MKLLSDETIDKLDEAIAKITEGIPNGTLIGGFRAWRRKLEQCIQNKGKTFE